jgi:immune inhibitor A
MRQSLRPLVIGIIALLSLLGLTTTAGAAGPTELLRSNLVPPRPDLANTLQMDNATYTEYIAQKMGPTVAEATVKQTASTGRELKAVGVNQALVALVQYSDLAHNAIPALSPANNTDNWVHDFSSTYYQTLLFDATLGTKSLVNYFKEASYNSYTLGGAIHNWTSLASAAALYGNDGAGGTDMTTGTGDALTVVDLVQDAADTIGADAAFLGTLTLGNYCSAGSVLDYFVVVHAGKGQESGGGALGDNAIWSRTGSLETPYPLGSTGYSVQNFIIVSEDAPLGVFVHMFGHLFGLPDTWNPDVDELPWPKWDQGGVYGEPAPAFYDPMAYGCWLGRPLGLMPASLTAWERIQLGWLSPMVWGVGDDPTGTFLAELERPSAQDKALKIELPSFAHSDETVRRAPDPSDLDADSTLQHDLLITNTGASELRWWQWYDLANDEATVEVLPPAAPDWITVLTFTGSVSETWVQQSVDLSPYLGQTVRVRFHYQRLTSQLGKGWFLDDFELWENGVRTWSDDVEDSDLGPGQGAPTLGYFWDDELFPRISAVPYYLCEWRNDQAGFDQGLSEVYNMVTPATGTAEYFKYNPGLLIWYVNPRYVPGDNNVFDHPGEGFLLAVDSHPAPLLQSSTGVPWRTRVQMQDAPFRASLPTYVNYLTDSGGTINTIGPKPARNVFRDLQASYPYWREEIPHNSVKTPEYGLILQVTGERTDRSGANLSFSIDAADMGESFKTVDLAVAEPGDMLTYQIVLVNTGIADAYSIVVSDTAPANTTYQVGSYTVDGSSSYTITEPGNAGIEWRGLVPLANPVTITFQVQLDPVIDNGTEIENEARIYEGTVLDTTVTATTTVESAPDWSTSMKVSDPTSVLAGDAITYTITLSNSGDMDTWAVLTDCLPLHTTYVSGTVDASLGVAWYDDGQGCIYWSNDMPAMAGPEAVITFTVQLDPNTPAGGLTNRAYVGDEVNAATEISCTTTVLSAPNMRESTKAVDLAVAEAGDTLEYTIGLYNSGNLSATILLTDSIPVSTTYVVGSVTSTGTAATFTPNRIGWAGTIAPLGRLTVTFDVTIDYPMPNFTTITNTAQILENGSKLYERQATTLVYSAPNLTNSYKTWEGESLGYGGLLTYTVSLVNDGTIGGNVIMTDTIPAGTEYYSGPDTGSYNAGLDAIQWNGYIASGDQVDVSFVVSITMTGTGIITNTAWIDDDVRNDPFPITCTTRIAAITVDTPDDDFYCGDVITVPVRIDNVEDLQGFQIDLSFDPGVLSLLSVEGGSTFRPLAWEGKIWDNELGTIQLYYALRNRPTGMTGSFELAVLTFRAVGDGVCDITIDDSKLSDSPYPYFAPIPHNRVDGSVTVYGRAVQGRVFLQGRDYEHGESMAGTSLLYGTEVLTTTDAGGYYAFCPPVGVGERFELKADKRGYLYGVKDITVDVTATLTLSDVTLIGGDVVGVDGETVSSPLTCTLPITVTRAGPPEGRIYINDLAFVGANFNKDSGSPDWGPDVCHPDYVAYKADINEDGYVDILDLVLVGYNFNETAPVVWP